jgi:beta-phosphoglucomutase
MKAFIFDLNGTLIDDMDYHTRGWLHVFNTLLGGGFSYENVKSHMYGKNSEVLRRVFGEKYFSDFEIEYLSLQKEERYRKEFLPRLALLPGLNEFLARGKACRIPMAIASAAVTANIDFVLDNLDIRSFFGAIVSADDVTFSKPDPESFLKAAELLGVSPADCIVFEDAPKGAEAAQNAGMPAIILTTSHQPPEFAHLGNIRGFWPNYQHYDEQIFSY